MQVKHQEMFLKAQKPKKKKKKIKELTVESIYMREAIAALINSQMP
jgi:hypothetical protein